MPKAKPDQVIVHRIEFQQSERDLLEMYAIGASATNIINALSPIGVALLDPVKLYGLLTILELADVLDTPLPTIGDIDASNPAEFFALLRQWILGSADANEDRRFNEDVVDNLAYQATESLRRAEETKQDMLDIYAQDPTPENWERVNAAQDEENRVRGEQKKRVEIAKSWKNWFWYEYGRWPKNYEVLAAKIRGDYYP